MHHQRDAHRFKAAAGQLRAVRGGGRHRVAVHVGKVDASLLKDTAIAQHPAASAAAAFPLPAIFDKFAPSTALSCWQIASWSWSRKVLPVRIGFH
jgi:hypothetical protein